MVNKQAPFTCWFPALLEFCTDTLYRFYSCFVQKNFLWAHFFILLSSPVASHTCTTYLLSSLQWDYLLNVLL